MSYLLPNNKVIAGKRLLIIYYNNNIFSILKNINTEPSNNFN